MDNLQMPPTKKPRSVFREFLESESAGGMLLMVAAAAALITANSSLAEVYFSALHAYIGPLSTLHWINDALMALFFLLVGAEIKREVVDGELATWPRRILPGAAAAGGMLVPAVIFVAINANETSALRGWAIPTATDIAFALGVLSLLGRRVPASMKVFLAALAIIDDLGAVLIIAVFYTGDLQLWYVLAALAVLANLTIFNRMGVLTLWPYSLLGVALWYFVLQSGIHATLAGVMLAMTIPVRSSPGIGNDIEVSPLHRLEHHLHIVVPFIVVPIFGFANAGVSFAGMSLVALSTPVTFGIALGLFAGKLIGVLGTSAIAIKSGLVDMPQYATWRHIVGVSLLCGIGFTMSLFVGLLAYPDSVLMQDQAKIGILLGSLISALAGVLVLRRSTPA
ncbi:MAG TPA: Na+/H+ antiporter NhaA [Rhizobiaceae bacterium]|nr:Na+/H+ antiporter NhaA [Rhizobiaceae bacterium]